MVVVSVKELKAKASDLLRRASAGESVVVTRRGEPAAVLVPLDRDELLDHALARSAEIARDLIEADEALDQGRTESANAVFGELKRKARRRR